MIPSGAVARLLKAAVCLVVLGPVGAAAAAENDLITQALLWLGNRMRR